MRTKSIDAVLIATPEHWHAQMVLDAIAAGKDVYVEKPLCHTPEEGIALLGAERKTKQIIQVGMQRRSYDLYLEGRRIAADGTLGNVRMVWSWRLNNDLGEGAGSPRSSRARVKRSEKGFGWATDLHVQNFLECIRICNTPAAPMRLGFQGARVVQLAIMSLKYGRRMKWNSQTNKVEM